MIDSLLATLLRKKNEVVKRLVKRACDVLGRLHNTKGHRFYRACKRKNYNHCMASQKEADLQASHVSCSDFLKENATFDGSRASLTFTWVRTSVGRITWFQNW